jgi:hypothetical protein
VLQGEQTLKEKHSMLYRRLYRRLRAMWTTKRMGTTMRPENQGRVASRQNGLRTKVLVVRQIKRLSHDQYTTSLSVMKQSDKIHWFRLVYKRPMLPYACHDHRNVATSVMPRSHMLNKTYMIYISAIVAWLRNRGRVRYRNKSVVDVLQIQRSIAPLIACGQHIHMMLIHLESITSDKECQAASRAVITCVITCSR